MLYDASRRVKKKLAPSRLRKIDNTTCTVRSSGDGGSEECLLTDAVPLRYVVAGPKKYLVGITN